MKENSYEANEILYSCIFISLCFLTEWQQGESADDGSGEHFHQGWSCQESELQSQDGSEKQEE